MSKGGGPLNAWLKEFSALVFTQTIQAFIYAIIISIILFGLNDKTDTTITADDKNASLGLMTVFALLSVFKVEDMARKIFGVGDSSASTKGAMQSLAKTAMAAQLGKRVLDNGGKVLGGAGKLAAAGKDSRKAKARLNEDMQDAGYTKGKDGNLKYTGKNKSTTTGGGTSRTADSSTGSSSSTSSGSTSESYGGESGSHKDPAKSARSALRSYEDKMDEIKKARRDGVKDMVTGLAEMGASIAGAGAGAVFSAAATGDLEDSLRGMVAGAGIGDGIAEYTINAIDKAAEFTRNSTKRYGSSTTPKKVKQALDNYNKEVERSTINYSNHNVEDI